MDNTHIDSDDVTFLQDSIARDTVNNFFIYRGTNRSGIWLLISHAITFESGLGAGCPDQFLGKFIQFSCCDAGPNHLPDARQNFSYNEIRFPHHRNFTRCF